MKITRASVEEYARLKGLEPVQVDGVPEGFSWKYPNIEIGGMLHEGEIINFKPLEYFNE